MFDAVSTGLAAILGAGIFAVIAPAAAIAGPALLISLIIAAFVAFCNALSSAQLAAIFPANHTARIKCDNRNNHRGRIVLLCILSSV
jgi:amino acid transporter